MSIPNIANTIDRHVRALPPHLQRETIDFVAYLEGRYGIAPDCASSTATEEFITRFAGCLGDVFRMTSTRKISPAMRLDSSYRASIRSDHRYPEYREMPTCPRFVDCQLTG